MATSGDPVSRPSRDGVSLVPVCVGSESFGWVNSTHIGFNLFMPIDGLDKCRLDL